MGSFVKVKFILLGILFITQYNLIPCFANTSTYEYNNGVEKVYTYNWNGAVGSTYKKTYSANFSIKDGNQYVASVSTNSNSVKMTQDDDYYYFDVNLGYKNEDLTYSLSKQVRKNSDNTSIEYQTIGDGVLYLTSEPINSIDYEYNSSSNVTTNYDHIDSGSTRGVYVYGSNRSGVSQSLYLKLNEKEGKQKMSLSIPSSAQAVSYSPTFTPDNSEVNSFLSAYNIYCSLEFPFEKYFNVERSEFWSYHPYYTETDVLGDRMYNVSSSTKQQVKDFYTYHPNSISSLITTFVYGTWELYTLGYNYNKASTIIGISQYLFTNGQANYTMPKRLDYNVIISNNLSKNFDVNYWNNSFHTKFRVKKTDINKYRYVNMYCPTAISIEGSIPSFTNTDNGSSGAVSTYTYQFSPNVLKSCSVRSGKAIDLEPYTHCNHVWIPQTNNDKNSHEVYCANCHWLKREPHTLEYEYDGILNNACMCGYISKVNYHFDINDNNTSIVDAVYDSFSDYIKYEVTEKVGYKFKWYEKYEKRYLDETNMNLSKTSTPIREVFVATCSNMTDRTDKYSTTYKAIYDPIKYTFKYSNINNKGLTLTGSIEDQVFKYGTPKELKDNIKAYGYGFKGWTLTANSNTIDFTPKQSILNYTNIDNDEYILYPVYDDLIFSVVLATKNGKFLNGLQVVSNSYGTADEISYEIPMVDPVKTIEEVKGYEIEVTTKYHFKNYKNIDGVEFNNVDEIRRYIYDVGIYNYVLYLTANFTTEVNRPYLDTSSDSYSSEVGPLAKKKVSPPKVEPEVPPEIPQEIVNSSLYSNLNKVLTKPVVDYIVTTPAAMEEMKEIMEIQGMSLSPSEEFFKKYGLKVLDKDYSTNYHKVEVIPVDEKAIFLTSLLKYKVVLLLLLFVGIGLYFLYDKKLRNNGK